MARKPAVEEETAGAVVCARCGTQGSLDDGEHGQVFWFCARCLHRHHDANSVTGA